MKITYEVHSVDPSAPIPVQATLPDGSTIEATVPGYVLELVADGGEMSHTFRLRGVSAFEVGDVVEAVFTKLEG